MRKRTGVLLLLTWMILLLAFPAQAAKINKKKVTITVGQTVQLKVKGVNAKKVRWTSSSKNVATVNKKGKVTGKKQGRALIRAKVGKKIYKCIVTVKAAETAAPTPEPTLPQPQVPAVQETEAPPQPVSIPITSVSISSSTLSLENGQSATLTASYEPSNTTEDTTAAWSSSNTAVATVSGGTVTAVGAGSATITVTIGSKSASCAVTVKPSMADYYQRVRDYIEANGITSTTDGNKFISGIQGSWFYTISNTSTGRLKLSWSNIYQYEESSWYYFINMELDAVHNPYVDPEFSYSFTAPSTTNNETIFIYVNARAHFDVSTYNGSNVLFTLLNGSAGSTTESIQSMANSSFKTALSHWNTLLKDEVGITLTYLGFSSY